MRPLGDQDTMAQGHPKKLWEAFGEERQTVAPNAKLVKSTVGIGTDRWINGREGPTALVVLSQMELFTEPSLAATILSDDFDKLVVAFDIVGIIDSTSCCMSRCTMSRKLKSS
jgi:hypothetical protein